MVRGAWVAAHHVRDVCEAMVMKLRIVADVLIGGVHFGTGSEIDTDERLGEALVQMRRAVVLTGDAQAGPETGPETGNDGVVAGAEKAVAVKRRKKD